MNDGGNGYVSISWVLATRMGNLNDIPQLLASVQPVWAVKGIEE